MYTSEDRYDLPSLLNGVQTRPDLTGPLSLRRTEIAQVSEDLPFIWQENTARSMRGVFRGAIDNPAIIAGRIWRRSFLLDCRCNPVP